MCGNDDVVISLGEGGCGASSETLRITKNYGCGLSDGTYTISRESSGGGCGGSTTSYTVDEATGRALIDVINDKRENIRGLFLRRK